MPYSSGDWWQGWGESCFLSTWTQPHNHLTTRTCKTHIHTHTSKLRIYCDSFLYVSVSFTGSQSAQLRATLCIIINQKTFFFFISQMSWHLRKGRCSTFLTWVTKIGGRQNAELEVDLFLATMVKHSSIALDFSFANGCHNDNCFSDSENT